MEISRSRCASPALLLRADAPGQVFTAAVRRCTRSRHGQSSARPAAAIVERAGGDPSKNGSQASFIALKVLHVAQEHGALGDVCERGLLRREDRLDVAKRLGRLLGHAARDELEAAGKVPSVPETKIRSPVTVACENAAAAPGRRRRRGAAARRRQRAAAGRAEGSGRASGSGRSGGSNGSGVRAHGAVPPVGFAREHTLGRRRAVDALRALQYPRRVRRAGARQRSEPCRKRSALLEPIACSRRASRGCSSRRRASATPSRATSCCRSTW